MQCFKVPDSFIELAKCALQSTDNMVTMLDAHEDNAREIVSSLSNYLVFVSKILYHQVRVVVYI